MRSWKSLTRILYGPGRVEELLARRERWHARGERERAGVPEFWICLPPTRGKPIIIDNLSIANNIILKRGSLWGLRRGIAVEDPTLSGSRNRPAGRPAHSSTHTAPGVEKKGSHSTPLSSSKKRTPPRLASTAATPRRCYIYVVVIIMFMLERRFF